MSYINHFIAGVPYSKAKSRGDKSAPAVWTETIKRETRNLPRVRDACVMKVTFLLPPDKFPSDLPYGSDLDNLLKRFMDALNDTVFSEATGKDSCVVSLTVMKTRAKSREVSGVHFEILPVQIAKP